MKHQKYKLVFLSLLVVFTITTLNTSNITSASSSMTETINDKVIDNIELITNNQDDCSYNPKKAKRLHDGRIAKIQIYNPSATKVSVKLYHPDGDGGVFASWSIAANKRTFLAQDGGNINIGSDWGIQVEDSCVYIIKKAASYQDGVWTINTSNLE